MTNEFSEDFLAGMAAARDIAAQTERGKTAAYAINRKLVAIRLRRGIEARRLARNREEEIRKFFSMIPPEIMPDNYNTETENQGSK